MSGVAVINRGRPSRAIRPRVPTILGAGLACVLSGAPVSAEPGRATRASGAITLDGRLDEPDWQAAPVASGFLQRDPDQGQPATEPTELRLLFDDHALYVGRAAPRPRARPDRPPAVAARRASPRPTRFTLYLDPHHDHRTGVVLRGERGRRPARRGPLRRQLRGRHLGRGLGVGGDASTLPGWTVEMRVPFSQLRFPATSGPRWGVNARRVVHRKNESSWLVLVPKNESGLASRMAELEGIDGIEPGRHVELLPYVVGPRGVHRPREGRRPLERRLALLRRRRARPRVRRSAAA